MKTRTINYLLIVMLTIIFIMGCAVSVALGNQNAYAEKETYYADSIASRDVITDTFSYAYYTEAIGYVSDSCPEYYNNNTSITNTCAPVAGAEIVSFYDRYKTSLISGYTPGAMVGGNYKYYPMTYQTSYPQGVINSLYSSMGTNSIEPGTSESQFQTGLTSYVTSAGYSISYASIKSGSSINYSSLVSYTSSGTITALFLAGYNYCNVSLAATSATYTITTYSGNHIMIIQGYKQITYYNSSNVAIRTDLLLKVSTGYSSPKNAWLYLGVSGTILDDALAISIS